MVMEIDVFSTFSKIKPPSLDEKGRFKEILHEIDDSLSFEIPGHEFSKNFKDGLWDGRRRLFSRSRLVFPTGKLSVVELIFDFAEITYKINDYRVRPIPLDLIIAYEFNLEFQMRDYQNELINMFLERDQGIIQAATGAGKTLVAAKIISILEVRTLIIVHTKDLLYQWKQTLETSIINAKIGQIGDGICDLQNITVATMQSLNYGLKVKIDDKDDTFGSIEDNEKNTDPGIIEIEPPISLDEYLNQIGFVIVDEVHRVPAETYYSLLMKIEAFYRLGLSASPWRDDNKDMMIQAVTGPIIKKITASELIRAGYLVQPKFETIHINPIYFKFTDKYARVYSNAVVKNDERNSLIVLKAVDLIENGYSVLILVKQINHGKHLHSLLKQITEHSIAFLSGKDKTEHRNSVLTEFKNGIIRTLIATTIADEGLDIPRLNAIILAGGGKSSTKALQRVGRVLRPFPGKDHAIIIEIFDHSKYLEEHYRERLRIYKTEPEFNVSRDEHLNTSFDTSKSIKIEA